MPRVDYSGAIANIGDYLSAVSAQRRGATEAGGLLGFHSIEEEQALKRALEKQERAQRAMQRRRGKGRLAGSLLGGGVGFLLGGPVGAGIGAGLLSYGGQKVAARSGVRAKRVGAGKFYTETRASANRALKDWIRDYKTSQVTGALTDAFSAYQLAGLTSYPGAIKSIKQKLSPMSYANLSGMGAKSARGAMSTGAKSALKAISKGILSTGAKSIQNVTTPMQQQIPSFMPSQPGQANQFWQSWQNQQLPIQTQPIINQQSFMPSQPGQANPFWQSWQGGG